MALEINDRKQPGKLAKVDIEQCATEYSMSQMRNPKRNLKDC